MAFGVSSGKITMPEAILYITYSEIGDMQRTAVSDCGLNVLKGTSRWFTTHGVHNVSRREYVSSSCSRLFVNAQ